MKRLCFICCFFLSIASLFGATAQVKIGVLYGLSLTEAKVSSKSYNTTILFDSIAYSTKDSVIAWIVVTERDSLSIFNGDTLLARCKSLHLIQSDHNVSSINHPKLKQDKVYEGKLSLSNNNGFLFIVNTLDLEAYLPGVLEAEVGLSRPEEYYKVQAIICRTYTLSHLRRHEMEDFNLCDKEHCQVYKGQSKKNTDLTKGVEKTAGIVIVDNEFNLITAAFHANCGGQTVNSEDVWNKRLDYLRSIKDTFCLRQKSAVWTKEISVQKWHECMTGLCKEYDPTLDSLTSGNESSFLQFSRKRYYTPTALCTIPLKDIRNSLSLKSTFFNVYQKNGQLIFNGKGFGHGAGLCQDGAIRMSKLGYSYKSILHFYYQNVSIVHLDKLDFFRFSE